MARIKIAFVAVFFALSALPVLEWATGLVDISALQERRRLAPLPDFAAIVLHGDGRLAVAINAWFDDRYGFRSFFVRLKHQLDYWAFRYSDKVIIGSRGWLYEPQAFAAAIAMERVGDAGAERAQRHFLDLARYLAVTGIRLIVVSSPSKEAIYPQFLPHGIPTLPVPGRYQEMRGWLRSRHEFEFIDGQDVLAQCQGWRTFNLIDIHMTMPGGVCFAKALIDRIAKAEGRSASPWDHIFTYSELRSTTGGQGDFLALLRPVSQMSYVPDHDYFGNRDPSFSTDPDKVYEWIYRAPVPMGSELLPPTVLFGDSFVDHYRTAGMQTYLSAMYRARDSGHNLAAVLEHLPAGTRYFIFESRDFWIDAIGGYRMPARDAAAAPVPPPRADQ
jgi:hypothetical protein